MGLRDRMGRGSRRRCDQRRDQVADLAEIRELARAASAYEDVPAEPAADAVHRSGFVDIEPSRSEVRNADGAAEPDPAGTGRTGRRAASWTHQWNPIEGGDLTPWMSPEERAAVEAELDDNPFLLPPRRPFTPTHEYVHEVHDPTAEDGPWRTERDEVMVVDRCAYSRESWEQDGSPDYYLDRDGNLWPAMVEGGPPIEPEEPLGWSTRWAEDEVEFIPRPDDRSTAELALDDVDPPAHDVTPAAREQDPSLVDDRLHPDFLAPQEEDRLDAVEARREDEWAARERAAEALDRVAAGNRDVAAAEPTPEELRRIPAAAIDLTPSEADAVRSDVEHYLEFGLE